METNGSAPASPAAPQIALAAAITIIMFISCVGNVLVLLVITNTRSLRRLNNVLIVSLAAIDLLRSVLVMPLFIVVELGMVRDLPYPLCSIYHALHLSCEMVSIYNLTAISLERVFVISWPLVYQLMITVRKMGALVCSLWVLGFTYGFLQIVWFIPKEEDDGKAWTEVYQEEVMEDICVYAPAPAFAIVDFIICFVVPFLTIMGCYVKIFCVVQAQMNKIAPANSTNVDIDQSDIQTYHPENSASSEKNKYDALEREERSSTQITEQKKPELQLRVQQLIHSHSSGVLKAGPTPVETLNRSRSVPDVVKPVQDQLRQMSLLQPALKQSSSQGTQSKRGSVTFRLDTHKEHTSILQSLRVVAIDDDTTMSTSDAATTDTSLSSSSGKQLPQGLQSQRSSVSSSTVLAQRGQSRHNSTASTATTSSKSRSMFRLSDNKAVRMTSIVVGAFMLCWLPYNILFLIRQIHPDYVSALAWDIASSVVFLSSAVNPFIYNFYSGEFRRALRRIATCTDKTNIPWA